MSQFFDQNYNDYLNEANTLLMESFHPSSKLDVEHYNEELQQLYVEIIGKNDFVPKTHQQIFDQLCSNACNYIIQQHTNESLEFRNNLYKQIYNHILTFNLNEEEKEKEDDNGEEEEFETENDHPLNTYELYLDRLEKNPCKLEGLLEQTHNEELFMIDKSNKNPKESDFVPLPINKPWGLLDAVKKVYENPSKEIFSFNKEENIMKSTKGHYFGDGKIVSNGLSKSVIENKSYAQKSINGKLRSVHRDLFMSFIGKNCNPEMVNHVDGNIHDNDLINFEASDRSHNGFHAIYELGKGTNIIIKRLNLENELNIHLFYSIKDASQDAQYSADRFSVNIKTKGFCDSKNKKYRYVYNDSTYVPSKRIVLDKLPKGCKPLTLIRQDGKETSSFGKRNIYHVTEDGEMFKEFQLKKYYKMKTRIVGGYVNVYVTDDNGIYKSYGMQRIVLIVHLDGQTGRTDHQDYTKLVVDHKNRIRSDNRVDNLRFVTLSENSLLAFGLKPLIMVSVERCTLEVYRYNKSQRNIMYDALFVDASVANEFLNSGISTIQHACACNIVMFGYIFDYVSDEFYQKYKNNQSDIYVIKGNTVALTGEMKSLTTGRTFTFDSLVDSESAEKLGVKDQQMSAYYSRNISKLPGFELSNGTIQKEFIFAKIKQDNDYKISSDFGFENITIAIIDLEDIKVSSGTCKKCWITRYINNTPQTNEFQSFAKANEYLGLGYQQIKNYINRYKDMFDSLLHNGQKYKQYLCCIYTEDNVYKCLKPAIQEFERFKCIVNDCSEIKFKAYQIMEKNVIFELRYPCKYQK